MLCCLANSYQHCFGYNAVLFGKELPILFEELHLQCKVSNLKTKAADSNDTLATNYQNTWCYIPEEWNAIIYCQENLKPHIIHVSDDSVNTQHKNQKMLASVTTTSNNL